MSNTNTVYLGLLLRAMQITPQKSKHLSGTCNVHGNMNIGNQPAFYDPANSQYSVDNYITAITKQFNQGTFKTKYQRPLHERSHSLHGI